MELPPIDRPRRSDPTRARILEAAKRRFAEHGYDATTIRAVASDAEIDPSMVMRYYGNKEGLFAAAADMHLRLPDFTQIPRSQWGRRLVRHFFDRWEDRPGESGLGLLLRSATTHEHAAARLRAIADQQVCSALEQAGVDEPARRASLVASQMLGLALCRYVLKVPPIASAEPDVLVGDLSKTIQRYITGPLTPPPS
jgi:AcrR family transcriptional regulator